MAKFVDWKCIGDQEARVTGLNSCSRSYVQKEKIYIQTNPGKNKREKVGGSWSGPAGYAEDNTPGKPDIEVGGDRKANQIHAYIVLTEDKTGCTSSS